MKMGQLRWDPMNDGFRMQMPGGDVPVTLRCRTDGVVCVEEVTDGHLSVRALQINVQATDPQTTLQKAAQYARQVRDSGLRS